MVEYRIYPKLGLRKKYLIIVYVGDVVRGIVEAAESPNTVHQTYFLNHPEVVTTKDVIQTIGRAMGKPWGLLLPVPIPVIRFFAPLPELVYHFLRIRPPMTRDKAREIAQRFWVADPSKAKRDFNWEAHYGLLAGMQQTICTYRAEQEELRVMPLEKGPMLWMKYVFYATLIGAVIETISYLGRFYTFSPWWAVFVIIVGAFGLSLGTLAVVVRQTSVLKQFLVGTIAAGAVEAMNALHLLPYFSWQFAPQWPFGITNSWVRSLVLGMAGGVFLLMVNASMRYFYKRRLRLG
jgi:hypothetical protein